jgi:RecA-family ATPase
MNTPVLPQTLAEILSLPTDSDQALLGDWLQDGMPVLIAGESGSGKSWFVYWLAACIANGLPAFDWNSSGTRRKVTILDGEMRLKTIQDRATIINDSLGDTEDRLTILARHTYRNAKSTIPSIQSHKERRELIDVLKTNGCQVLIVDNLNALMPDGCENDPQFWKPVEEFVRECQDQHITLIVVHHTTKTNLRSPAGSSRNSRIFEMILIITKINQASPGANFQIEFNKFRDKTRDAEPRIAKLVKDEDANFYHWKISNDCCQQNNAEKNDDKKLFAQALFAKGESQRSIAQKIGVAPSTVNEWKKKENWVSGESTVRSYEP